MLRCICPGRHYVCRGDGSKGCRYKLRPQSAAESAREVAFCLSLYPELRMEVRPPDNSTSEPSSMHCAPSNVVTDGQSPELNCHKNGSE